MNPYKKTIIVADSCAGGVSVLRWLNHWAGDYHIKYLADYEKNPFGLKSSREIQNIVRSWFKNLVNRDKIALFIVACNTASIASKEIFWELENNFSVPVVNMVTAMDRCIKNNQSNIKGKNVAIIATRYTIRSGEYQRLIEQYNPQKIIEIIATNSEREVALGTYKTRKGKVTIFKELHEYACERVDTVILACTVFQSIQDQIKKILGTQVKCINPEEEISYLAMKALDITIKTQRPKITIWSTFINQHIVDSLKMVCQRNLHKAVDIKFLKLIR